jgi:hypothetical protein
MQVRDLLTQLREASEENNSRFCRGVEHGHGYGHGYEGVK